MLRLNKYFAFNLAAAVLLSCSAQAGTPDWMRHAARGANGAHAGKAKAVVLMSTRSTQVNESGEVRTVYRKVYRILRPEGRDYGRVKVYFRAPATVDSLKGWSITPEGREFEVKDSTETSVVSDDVYSDVRVRNLTIPGANPGSVIAYEYQERARRELPQDIWFFQDDMPVQAARFELELPASWKFETAWFNHPTVAPQPNGPNRWVWDVKELPPIEEEPLMPAWRAVAGHVGISYLGGRRFSRPISWSDVGSWYAGLTLGRREITPEIRKAAESVTAAETDPLAKARKLASYVQNNIRYVAIEIGIGGYQPHVAASVFLNKYGDCKDKVTLLSTMLKAVGIESHYVLVNSDRGTVHPNFPSVLGFNHVVLAIQLPQDISSAGLPARLSHPRFGDLLIFDPTDTWIPFGNLPDGLQAGSALLVSNNEGELIQIPVIPPPMNQLVRTGVFQLDAQGTLQGKVEERRTGATAARVRGRLRALSQVEQKKFLEDLVQNLIQGARVLEADAQTAEDGSLTIKYRLICPEYAQMAGEYLLFRPRIMGVKSLSMLDEKPRDHAVQFPSTVLDSDTFDVTLGAGFKVEEMTSPVALEYSFGSYRSKAEKIDDKIRYSRTFELRGLDVPKAQLPSLKTFFEKISEEERATALLKATLAR